jgi:hypothetical protein
MTSIYWFLGVVVIALLIGSVWQENSRRRNFRVLTDKFGLTQTGLGWYSEKYKGQYRGQDFKIELVNVKNAPKTLLCFEVGNKTHRSFSLAKNGFYRQSESFGSPVFQSGDEVFDKRFVFKTQAADFAKKFLSRPHLRQKLLDLKDFEVDLINQQLEFRQNGDATLHEPAKTVQALDALIEIVNLIENFELDSSETHSI